MGRQNQLIMPKGHNRPKISYALKLVRLYHDKVTKSHQPPILKYQKAVGQLKFPPNFHLIWHNKLPYSAKSLKKLTNSLVICQHFM